MNLLKLLFGGGSSAAPAAGATGPGLGAPPHQWVTDANGYVTMAPPGAGLIPQAQAQAPMQPPVQQPGALVQSIAQNSPAAPSNQTPPSPSTPPDAVGQPYEAVAQRPDNWKPHHAGVLGQIADYFLGTHFGKENTRRNMAGALEHLNTNPDEAVRRLAEFDPQSAMDLFSKVNSEKHWNAMADHQTATADLANMKAYMPIVSGIFNHITHDDKGNVITPTPQTWSAAVRQARVMGQRYKIPDDALNDMLPEQIDMDAAGALASGSFPVARQAAIAEQHSNHGVQHNDRMSGQAIARERNQILARQGDARIGISQENADTAGQNADTAEFNAQTGRDKATTYITNNTVRTVHVPGRPGYGQTVKGNSKQMIWFMPDGTKHLYLQGKGPNDWHYAHQMIGKDQKAKGTSEPEAPDDE